jgi:peptide deformylase
MLLFALVITAAITVHCQKEEPIVYKAPVPVVAENPLKFTEAEKVMIMESDTDMRVLTIFNYEDSLVLRAKCKDVTPDSTDEVLMQLINRMYLAMMEEGGVGIAAPQIGIKRNVFWAKRMDKPGGPFEYYLNPKILVYGTKEITFIGDGCLSIPGMYGNTIRSSSIKVGYNLIDGSYHEEIIQGYSGANFTSICFQHEYDHLNGVLWIDRQAK